MSEHPDAYTLLKSIIHHSTSSLPIETKLDQMLQSVSSAFQSDRCFLLRPDHINSHGFLSRVASEKKSFWVDEGSFFQAEDVLLEEKGLLSPTFACIPLWDETTFQGILYISFLNKKRFSPQDVDLLLLIAEEMTASIRNAHLHQKAEQTISELTALHEMGKAVSSTLRLRDLLELFLITGLKTLKAKGGVLRVEDKTTGELKVKCSRGDDHQNPLDEKIARRVFFTRTPISLNHSGEERPFLSILCAPLLSRGGVLGTLTFYNKEADPSKFDERDFQLLLTMANQMSCAIENALTHHELSSIAQEHEKRALHLSTLWELSKALLTTMNFEQIIHLTLTAITIGDGLGFNRAMLFLVNEKGKTLEGILAVGPDSAEEAGKIWATLSQKKGSLSDLIAQLQLSPEGNAILCSIIKEIQIPLEQKRCILSRTVLEARPFNIQLSPAGEEWLQIHCERGCNLGSEVGCGGSERLSHPPRVYSFATVPLLGKGKVIGVILVDNLYNQNPITEEDLHVLGMFSNQAGLAIENAILYRNLEEVYHELKETQTQLCHHEKMTALGELSNTIAHEIKNPLVSIGGFARRLDRAISDESQEKKYTQTIVKEVTRLEKIFDDTLNYIRDESLVLKEYDLRDVLKKSLSMISQGFDDGDIQLVKEFPDGLPHVIGDDQLLKQAFFNLITNARQAMNGKGTLTIRINPISKNGSSFIKVEIEDTGKGIDPEHLHNIFNPFYSRENASLGLGLSIVHKIVTTHRGQVEVDNHPGKGATFIVTLPAKKE
jgi:two-component system sensor histidine kinase HydH